MYEEQIEITELGESTLHPNININIKIKGIERLVAELAQMKEVLVNLVEVTRKIHCVFCKSP